jgi:hypothetical protein
VPQSVAVALQSWERGGVVTLITVPPPPTQLTVQGAPLSVTVKVGEGSGEEGARRSSMWALVERVTETGAGGCAATTAAF